MNAGLLTWTGRGLADAKAVAAHMAIGTRTLRRLISEGRFGPQAQRIGGNLRYLQAEVDAWIEEGMPRSELWAVIWKTRREKKEKGR